MIVGRSRHFPEGYFVCQWGGRKGEQGFAAIPVLVLRFPSDLKKQAQTLKFISSQDIPYHLGPYG